jgi:hypothetical protein
MTEILGHTPSYTEYKELNKTHKEFPDISVIVHDIGYSNLIRSLIGRTAKEDAFMRRVTKEIDEFRSKGKEPTLKDLRISNDTVRKLGGLEKVIEIFGLKTRRAVVKERILLKCNNYYKANNCFPTTSFQISERKDTVESIFGSFENLIKQVKQ